MKKRTTISIDGDLLDRAREASGGNLSAYVERALWERESRTQGRLPDPGRPVEAPWKRGHRG
jgi:post-segregation antitoxin (ccd killing protein)